MVDPLPHQITAVYGEMLPRQPLRFLLADDPGAGKTIMAGLLIKELLIRGDLHRCMIVCPVNPAAKAKMTGKGMWTGARGLADDVRYYGQWMRDRAFEQIGHLYPKVNLPEEYGGGEATVIAWLWARTVVCPNPACGAQMLLVKSFVLSARAKKRVWVEPIVDQLNKTITFIVRTGDGETPDSPKVGRGAKFRCLICREIAPDQHIKDEGAAGRMDTQLMAMVAEGVRGRVYISPDQRHGSANRIVPEWAPEQELANDPRNRWCIPYGLRRFRDLFTSRQLVALSKLSDLVNEARMEALNDGASGEYADDMACYLGLLVSRLTNTHAALAVWSPTRDQSKNVFARQALPMVWDFAEVNPFAGAAGDFGDTAENLAGAIAALPACRPGRVAQLDAAYLSPSTMSSVYSTDPPYYDNIGYADLSDFFYVWLRRSLATLKPQLFSTLLAPKNQELVATPYRFQGSNDFAQRFFEEGFGKVFVQMSKTQNPQFPLTVYYAFKQSESDDGEEDGGPVSQASTGWETMLEGLLKAGLQVTATWPMRSERAARSVAIGTNALASSIVLACRPRSESAPITTRKDFLIYLKKELPNALRNLQKGNIAPVDLAQAAIGPGMAAFSRYKKVLETDGSPMRVRTALALINQGLDEVLCELESEFDPDTHWALAWFPPESHGHAE